MNIGEAAKASGVSSKMIRYYEETGLIPAAKRSGNGYRSYGAEDVHTLRFIHRARRLGFSLARIGQLVRLWQDDSRASHEVKAIAEEHIAELTAKIGELDAMRRTLRHLTDACHGNERPNCPILDDLAGLEVAELRSVDE